MLTTPFALIFLSNLFIAFESKLLTNPGTLSLAKAVARSAIAFIPKLPNQEPKDTPACIILDIWVLLSLIPFYIYLIKAFPILVVCVVARNNSCNNCSSSKFFLFILDIVPVLFLLQMLIWLCIC